jgi:hypothetical protein
MYVQVDPITITLNFMIAPLLFRSLSSSKHNRSNISLNTHPADRGQYSQSNQIKLQKTSHILTIHVHGPANVVITCAERFPAMRPQYSYID